jgi:hypothetical protein
MPLVAHPALASCLFNTPRWRSCLGSNIESVCAHSLEACACEGVGSQTLNPTLSAACDCQRLPPCRLFRQLALHCKLTCGNATNHADAVAAKQQLNQCTAASICWECSCVCTIVLTCDPASQHIMCLFLLSVPRTAVCTIRRPQSGSHWMAPSSMHWRKILCRTLARPPAQRQCHAICVCTHVHLQFANSCARPCSTSILEAPAARSCERRLAGRHTCVPPSACAA